MILLHGFPEFWYAWRRQILALGEAGFRVVAPDQRGYNLSDKPRRVSAYAIETLARDVVGLIDEAGRERAMVAGHDWGGLVAWWTAVRFPERLERLAVLNAPHPAVFLRHLRSDPEQRKRSWYVRYFQLPWFPERWYRKNNWEIGVRSVQGTARPGSFSDEEMERYREAWSRPGAIRAMINWYRAAVRHRPRKAESLRVRVPTLIVWGARDRFLGQKMVEPSLAMCDSGRAELLDEATHWVQHDEPERVGRLLRYFFSEPSGDSARAREAGTPRRG